MDSNLPQEVAKIKHELMLLIKEHLKNNQIEAEEAQKLAADFLAILPVRSWNDLLVKLRQLSQNHKDAKGIYVEELQEYEMIQKDQTLNQMRDHIKKGDIESAISVAKSMKVVQ